MPKPSWNISHDQDWTAFRNTVDNLVSQTDLCLNSDALSSRVAEILLQSGRTNIGFHLDLDHFIWFHGALATFVTRGLGEIL